MDEIFGVNCGGPLLSKRVEDRMVNFYGDEFHIRVQREEGF